jgi:hypothetical protein
MTYKEFCAWAEREVTDRIISEGFKGIAGALAVILQVSRQYEKEGWKKP